MDILKKTLFPFSRVRDEQKSMLEDVVKAVSGGSSLLAHAPTGIGKTAAALAPTLAYARDASKTVFFLTPKHSQHHIAVETIKKISQKYNKKILAVDIIGKQWTCLYEGARDLHSSDFKHFCRAHKRNETCRFCNKVFDSGTKDLSDAAKKAISEIKRKSPLHSEEMLEICRRHELCTYEISTILARSADVIICDYYHMFHPSVRQALLGRMDKSLSDIVLVIDEAHNLPERIRGLMSSRLNEFTLSLAAKEATSLREDNLVSDLDGIAAILGDLGNKMKSEECFIKKEDFVRLVEEETHMNVPALVEDLEAFGESVLELPNRNRSYAMSVANFLSDWTDKKKEEAYARILNKYMSSTGKRYQLQIKCLDPAIYAEDVFSSAYSSVLMSGTFLPLEMYASVLGIHNPTLAQYENPFPQENRLVLLTPGITTKFSHRTQHMWNKIAKTLSGVISSVPGNVAAFFPSYYVLDTVSSMVDVGTKEALIERQDMGKTQRYGLYTRLARLADEGGGVLFAVQAGSFSEGMDFPGKMLDCAVVVGLPLERPTLETDALIKYYDFKFGRGWDYGYIYPAMNKALQAAGRCIRSEEDRGAIILMDDRFKWQNYKKCFPKDMRFILTEKPAMYLDKFFQAQALIFKA